MAWEATLGRARHHDIGMVEGFPKAKKQNRPLGAFCVSVTIGACVGICDQVEKHAARANLGYSAGPLLPRTTDDLLLHLAERWRVPVG